MIIPPASATPVSTPTAFTAHAPLPGRRLLSDYIHDVLLTGIIHGAHAPGERLNVDDIAAALDVSRTPVREAITRLSWTGFVTVQRNSRTLVADWTPTVMAERLHVIGRLAALMAADPEPPTSIIGAAATGHPDTITAYLATLELLVNRGTNRVAAHTIRDHLTPLRIFLTPDTATHHGIDLTTDEPHRDHLIGALITAATNDDRTTVVTTLTTLTNRLATTITRRGELTT
jgi:hypothetical protein